MDICSAVVLLEAGVLPVAGGWCDQAATFVQAVLIVSAEKAEYDRRRIEKANRGA